MKRTFVAVRVNAGEKLLKTFGELRERLIMEKIKWVKESDLHITLFFTGNTAPDMIPVICDELRQIAADTISFSFEINEAGIFGTKKNPRVIWLGITEARALFALHNLIRERLESLGFRSNDKDFNPHLTLGRIKYGSDRELLASTIGEVRNTHFQSVEIREFFFFESRLLPRGPEYIPLGIFPLRSETIG
ncbi:MAG: RNA 2',3'-cyclic phosphodiesterase [Bacteroidetes bacterium]|nr:RNA 2',3'-cyclic phosphodiesterase [Bacteroidota bacterium]